MTASCAETSSVCFCTSIDHEPRPSKFDLNIIEIYAESPHYFLLETGKEKISSNLANPNWDEIADRCLSCANYTMVCPTCFAAQVTIKVT
ncbi:MAG: hypothetical protein AB8G05_15605 [Oligoflexales bacterium]